MVLKAPARAISLAMAEIDRASRKKLSVLLAPKVQAVVAPLVVTNDKHMKTANIFFIPRLLAYLINLLILRKMIKLFRFYVKFTF